MPHRKLSDDEVLQISELYLSMPQRELAARFGVSQPTIGRIVKNIEKPKLTAQERFWAKVDSSGGPDECWPWIGSQGTNEYGTFKLSTDKTVSAHRYAYELATGKEIPKGMHLCHSCDKPCCCNPKHLSVDTPSENTLQSIQRGHRYRGGRMPKLDEILTLELQVLAELGYTLNVITDFVRRNHMPICRTTVKKACGTNPIELQRRHVEKERKALR